MEIILKHPVTPGMAPMSANAGELATDPKTGILYVDDGTNVHAYYPTPKYYKVLGRSARDGLNATDGDWVEYDHAGTIFREIYFNGKWFVAEKS